MPVQSYNIVVVESAESPTIARAFDDIALLIQHSLRSLGLECSVRRNEFESGATNIVLGYHVLEDGSVLSDFDSII